MFKKDSERSLEAPHSVRYLFVRYWRMGKDSLTFMVGISVPNTIFMIFLDTI